jgi:hypothetical protein
MAFEFNALTGLSNTVAILRDNGLIGNRETEAVQAYHQSLRADGIPSTFHYSG